MKLLLIAVVVCTALFTSCRKETTTDMQTRLYLENVKTVLKDSLLENDFDKLDFTKAFLSKCEKEQRFYLRIPFKEKKISEEFVIVRTDASGHIYDGRIVQLQKNETNAKQMQWDGLISISSLTRNKIIESGVENGYIKAFHSRPDSRTSLVEPIYADNVLPEVVIVAYISSGDGISYSSWLWLNSLFYGSGGGGGYSGSGLYGSMDGDYYSGGGGYAGSGYYNTVGEVSSEEMMEYEPEYIYNEQTINVWRFFNCFDNIPNAGATYSIKLCADIPSNNNPGASSMSEGSNVGHSFLTITKANGNAMVSQSFGFYPQSAPSLSDPFGSVPSVTKDNGEREFNASIDMDISEAQFTAIKNLAISWSGNEYNLGSYNCTNYALDVFNSIRATPLTISPYKIYITTPNQWGPSESATITIEKSPQMLFLKLQSMKNNNNPEALHIQIDQTHNSVSPTSKGECN